ncbi:hypothetical protein GCM10023350_26910 [Nocardioides endophyticus]|uniref:WD40 repeat domain-containing protein n=1 Tax=Nocardioides endophyticus TaxID=1353775 RepID=A0ABP8YZ54_9ACTN
MSLDEIELGRPPRAVRRLRRGPVIGAGATVLAVALVVGGVVAVRDGWGRDVQPAPQVPTPTETTSPGDAEYQDLPVWWSPDLDQELNLPWLRDSPLPREIDLTAEVPHLADSPIERAVAAFAGPDFQDPRSVVLVAPDGDLRRLDLTALEPWEDATGVPHSLATPSMLSPDGRRLVFPQHGHLSLYDLATHEWSQLDARGAETAYVRWQLDDLLVLPRERAPTGPLFSVDGVPSGRGEIAPPQVLDLMEAMRNPYGLERAIDDGVATRSAQSWGMGPAIPIRESAVYFAGPAYLVVTGGLKGSSILAFMTGIDDERWMDAPPVAGWLDADTVVYESVAEDRDLLIAWDVDTRTFRRVMSVTPGWQSSFARLHS